jgi:hypothetical protein
MIHAFSGHIFRRIDAAIIAQMVFLRAGFSRSCGQAAAESWRSAHHLCGDDGIGGDLMTGGDGGCRQKRIYW